MMALDQLRLDMPKAAFDTWLSSTRFVAFEDGVFTFGTLSAYGRDWLFSRSTSAPRLIKRSSTLIQKTAMAGAVCRAAKVEAAAADHNQRFIDRSKP